jgi:hypothetical protein
VHDSIIESQLDGSCFEHDGFVGFTCEQSIDLCGERGQGGNDRKGGGERDGREKRREKRKEKRKERRKERGEGRIRRV